MRVLHTSDWHIGRTLYGRKRYEEFEAFLTWLAETIQQNEIDALLVAGDVFDTSAPSNRAQELYYRFLCRVAASSCRHVVVVAGNHDSPSFLNAPKELLKALDVHVVGSSTESLEDEVLVLRNEQDAPELIVCAVPYLRDRDIRVAEAGESVEDKERKLIDGIRTHYAAVAALAEQKREELGVDIPIVGTGHLFTAGGQTVDGDGVREMPDGTNPLIFRMNWPSDSTNAPRMAELLAATWAQIGVKAELQALDPDALTSICCPAFDFDVILWGWGSDPDPNFLLSVMLTDEIPTGNSETGYGNPDYDALYKQQAVELDKDKRIEMVHEMQKIVFDDVVYIIPFYAQSVQAFRTDRFTGWQTDKGKIALEDPSSLLVIEPAK